MAGKPIATVGSMHTCPMCTGTVPHVGGPITGPGQPGVLINGKPVATIGDMCICSGPPDTIAQGEPGVFINGVPVATLGSMTAHGGSITQGEVGVTIKSATPKKKITLPIKKIPFPEIRIYDYVGAALVGESSNLKEAQKNQEKIKEEAKIKSPRLISPKWKTVNGANISVEHVATEKVYLSSRVYDIEDGETVTFKVFSTTKNGKRGKFLGEVSGTVEDEVAQAEWTIDATHLEDKGGEDEQ